MDCKESRLTLYKTSSADYCAVGDIIAYQIKVINISSTLVEDAIIKDLLPTCLKFVKGSVKVNGEQKLNENIVSGIYINTIDIEECYIIDFNVEVLACLGGQILNESMAEYKYFECDKYFYDFCISNCNIILVKNPSIIIDKIIDKEYLNLGDEVNCKIIVQNNGNLDIFNIHLIDNLSSGLEIVQDSFCINNFIIHSINLNQDILLGNLVAGGVIVVKYRAKVISGGYCGKIKSNTHAVYNYKFPNNLSYCKKSNLCELSIDVSPSNFKQLSIKATLRFFRNFSPYHIQT